jgi:uroporphyrinogen decarboxylase
MTEKERFVKALKREPLTGLVPHFELVFYLTMESLGKVHPTHRTFNQWNQMSSAEKKAQGYDMAQVYVDIARKYNHSAICVHSYVAEYENAALVLDAIRKISGDEYFIMLHGDPTFQIPSGETMIDFTADLYEQPEKMHNFAKVNVQNYTDWAQKFQNSGLVDGFVLCADYCFNTNPFFNQEMFGEFIVPYLKGIIKNYHDMGFYSIKHTDGNIMPILQQMVDCEPDAIHSLDPQGGVDLKNVKKLVGDKVCLVGNVNCGLLQTGTEDEVIRDVRRCLSDGMPGFGYIFSTSNCIFTGLELKRYELMNKVWREYGNY